MWEKFAQGCPLVVFELGQDLLHLRVIEHLAQGGQELDPIASWDVIEIVCAHQLVEIDPQILEGCPDGV